MEALKSNFPELQQETMTPALPMMLPVLNRHDAMRVVGFMQPRIDGILVRLDDPLTHKEFIAIFGNCGMVVVEVCSQGAVQRIKSALIKEWSVL